MSSASASELSRERADALAPTMDGARGFRLSVMHASPSRAHREQVGNGLPVEQAEVIDKSHFVRPRRQAMHEWLVRSDPDMQNPRVS